MVACWAHNPEVAGSNPVFANYLIIYRLIINKTTYSKKYFHFKETDEGSIPFAAQLFVGWYLVTACRLHFFYMDKFIIICIFM